MSSLNASSFSWVVGPIFSVEVYGDFAILNQGEGAFSVVQISTKSFCGCSPTWSYAQQNLRRVMARESLLSA